MFVLLPKDREKRRIKARNSLLLFDNYNMKKFR